MKNRLLRFGTKLFVVSCFIVLSISAAQAQQLAFPTAEGFGRYTTGGRGGSVYEVTNLNDDGLPGSLRYAINRSGARTIVFRVSGTIALSSDLKIKNGNLTIAGQTAPGDGICIKDYQFIVDASNVIIRYMRFRVGNLYVATTEPDAFQGQNRKDIIIDHCSMSWSVDEVASFYDNENFTMQWCIVSESLYNAGHSKGAHGYGGIEGGMKASFHHNLYASNTSRNPRFCGARYHQATASTEIVDFRNNVLFNWGFQSVYGGEYGQQNMVNNYYKYGPATQSNKKNRIVEIQALDGATSPGKWYIDGNYTTFDVNIVNDNWLNSGTSSGGIQGGDANDAGVRSLTEFGNASSTVTTETALNAYNSVVVLGKVGANFPARDAVDTRILSEVQSGVCAYGGTYAGSTPGTGIIDNPATVGGWPVLNSIAAPTDTDQDGMPDSWETSNGLNPNDAADRNTKGADGYTVLEKYLNCLVGECVSVVTYTLNVSTNTTPGSGCAVIVEPVLASYADGYIVKLTSSVAADSILQNWTGDTTGTSDPFYVKINANKNVVGNFVNATAMFFELDTIASGPGSITLSPLPGVNGYLYGTVVTITAVPDNVGGGDSFYGWSGFLSGTTNPETITMLNNRSVTATFLSGTPKKIAYVTNPLSGFYGNDTQILPALKADPRFVVTEVLPTADLSSYDVVLISEVPGSTETGMSALEGINKPVIMMKVHSYKPSVPTALSWGWIIPATGYGQDDTQTKIVVSNTSHPMFNGVTFVNTNEVNMLTAVAGTPGKGLTFMDPTTVTSVTDGSIISTATIYGDANKSCIVEIPAGTVVSGKLIPQNFIQIGINSTSYANVTADAVTIIENACIYLSNTFDPSIFCSPETSDKTFALNENSSNGTVVGSVPGWDADLGQTLTYAITGGNADGKFAINSSTGEITVAGTIDFEALSTYSLSVEVTDDGATPLTSSSTVTVNVTDLVETGIADAAFTSDITIYPNPSKKVVNILSNGRDLSNAKVKVFNIYGTAVLETDFRDNLIIEGLDAGMYSLIITLQDKVAVKKLIVE